MKRRFKNMFARHRKCGIILTFLFVYISLLYLIAPTKMSPTDLSKHPLFEAQNISEYKEKNNLRLILIWTRIQVCTLYIFARINARSHSIVDRAVVLYFCVLPDPGSIFLSDSIFSFPCSITAN